jgi:hypothetical protein
MPNNNFSSEGAEYENHVKYLQHQNSAWLNIKILTQASSAAGGSSQGFSESIGYKIKSTGTIKMYTTQAS